MLKPLLDKCTPLFPDRSRTCVKNLLVVTQSVLLARTTCLNKVKYHVGHVTGALGTDAESHYKRLIRFFDAHAADDVADLWLGVAAATATLLRLKSTYLTLDGTSWSHGERDHHFLTLSVVYRGVAIPLLWCDLAKKGSSSRAEREALLDLACERFDLRGKVLLADREYVGVDWFKYLISKGIGFCIRSKRYAYYTLVDRSAPGHPKLHAAIAAVERSRKANKALSLPFRLTPDGPLLHYGIAKNPDPDAAEAVMVLVTTEGACPYEAVDAYLVRWKCEQGFRHLKSNGFDLEAINLATPARRNLLIACVAFAYALACVEGLRTFRRVVREKRHGSAGTLAPAQSIFRYGAGRLSRHTANLVTFLTYLADVIARALRGYRSSTIINV